MSELTVRPLTPSRWRDLETLFGANGACGGCWCMYFRQNEREYAAGKGEKNRHALRQLVEKGSRPGLIGYLAGEPVAWVAVEPRNAYARIARSRTTLPAAEPVWSVPCFFVKRGYRGQGLTRRMLEAATALAQRKGARVVEGYPIDPGKGMAAFAFPGVLSVFRQCGFKEVARRAATRPVMRLQVED